MIVRMLIWGVSCRKSNTSNQSTLAQKYWYTPRCVQCIQSPLMHNMERKSWANSAHPGCGFAARHVAVDHTCRRNTEARLKSVHGIVDALQGQTQQGRYDPYFASFKLCWYQSKSPRMINTNPKYLFLPLPHKGVPARLPATLAGS